MTVSKALLHLNKAQHLIGAQPMKLVLKLNIILLLFISNVCAQGKEIALELSYNKVNVSQNGGFNANLNTHYANRINTRIGFSHLGTLSYNESFGLITYNMMQVETSLGYSLFDSQHFRLNASIGSVFGLSSVTLSSPPAGHDGYISRAFFPSGISRVEGIYFFNKNISMLGGYTIQTASFLGDQPWLNHWHIGVGFNFGKEVEFKSQLAFDNKVTSTNILKKIDVCQLCQADFYSLLIGEFASESELLNALEHPKINALLSTKYYLSNPQSFYYYVVGSRYYFFFGEFAKIRHTSKWEFIWQHDMLLTPKVKKVSHSVLSTHLKVNPILKILKY